MTDTDALIPTPQPPDDGIGLALSGGGYRAMLFHVGALWRLHEAGLLAQVCRISSVSGGSITAGVLGLAWKKLQAESPAERGRLFRCEVATKIRELASRTMDWSSVVLGALMPWSSPGQQIAERYDQVLFSGATLQDLPDQPRFVINASNLQSGALWRFSKPYARDWKVGKIARPKIRLAVAVAASSAFPPFLSPLRLRLRSSLFTPGSGAGLQRPPYTTRLMLTDGGVYDNLGLESVFKRYSTLLVSDGGMAFASQPRPFRNWAFQMYRVLGCIDNQVRSLRKRDLMEAYQLRDAFAPPNDAAQTRLRAICSRQGAYWGIATPAASYPEKKGLHCPPEAIAALATISTRLAAMPPAQQERLINWGYASCDYAVRSYYVSMAPPADFPYCIGV